MKTANQDANNVARSVSRRGIFLRGSAALALSVAGTVSNVKATPARIQPIQTSFDVTQAPFNADQTGKTDASTAFQDALNAISQLGKGELIVPAGNYKLDNPLVCNNASVTIVGFGQASSILAVTHAMTAITINCNTPFQSVTLRDFGMAPVSASGGAAGVALSLNFPGSDAGWQHCTVENVDLGVAYPSYSTFMGGISFTNVWRGNMRNVNMHSQIGNVPGSFFFALNGLCVDNRFTSCSIDGVDVAFLVNSYCEGVHITDTVIIGNTAISTGTTSYSGNGTSSPKINLLGLYITSSEFNCRYVAMNLFQVYTGWINSSHFDSLNLGAGTVVMQGSQLVQFQGCAITGQFNQAAPTLFIGIRVGPAPGWASADNTFDNCLFTNLACGLYFDTGTRNSTAVGVRMLSPGNGALLSGPLQVGQISVRAQYDESGNYSNTIQLIASSDGPGGNTKSGRFLYSKP